MEWKFQLSHEMIQMPDHRMVANSDSQVSPAGCCAVGPDLHWRRHKAALATHNVVLSAGMPHCDQKLFNRKFQFNSLVSDSALPKLRTVKTQASFTAEDS